MLLSNLSLRKPAQVSFLFRVPSLILGVFRRSNCLRFLFFTILHIDDRLVPVCLVIFLGAKFVWGRSSYEQTYQIHVPCEFCEISKNTFLHRAPLVAASLIAPLSTTK